MQCHQLIVAQALLALAQNTLEGTISTPLQVFTVLRAKFTCTGEQGVATTYARSNHTHHVNLSNDIPLKHSGTGIAGSANIYSSATHQHPLNVELITANIPLVNATFAANGTSDYYSRHDHVYPQQLIYDENVSSTKFIKSGGLAMEILCANGDTTKIDSKLSRTFTDSGLIRLCNFPADNSVGNSFIEYKIYISYNSVQTVRLQHNYTVNGITNAYGIFNAPSYIGQSYIIENVASQLFHNHSGSGTSAIYSIYIQLETVETITIVVSDKSTYYTNRITEILTQDVVSGVSNGTKIPINYNYRYGGFLQYTLQVNPTDRTKSSYNNGIRIGNYLVEAALYLGCSNTAINTTQTGQWEISKISDKALTINPSSLRQADHSVGLSVNGYSSKITFNDNELVNIGTDQTIIGRKTFADTTLGCIQLNPTDVSYDEDIRIANRLTSYFSAIYIGTSTSQSGEIDGQWTIIKRNAGELIISRTADQNFQNKGLKISSDGNTLSFNGSVIAGTGATNGASLSQTPPTANSVNYSAGNPIIWGANSTDPIGGFYSNGAKVYWRAHPLTMGSVPP
ncbi:MAG: hypothetical protein EZS28_022396 [Streblomastix strix]|uniref:Uncharacterized protein n=1 Tax=Streblomastix strix TaxID=222440 RepID=A0A5J4VI61_9EUKA|nr:MAG: hypothetical protein EZS28_022396 [Streblomastix strix]